MNKSVSAAQRHKQFQAWSDESHFMIISAINADVEHFPHDQTSSSDNEEEDETIDIFYGLWCRSSLPLYLRVAVILFQL